MNNSTFEQYTSVALLPRVWRRRFGDTRTCRPLLAAIGVYGPSPTP
jgi:hypothetical protein